MSSTPDVSSPSTSLESASRSSSHQTGLLVWLVIVSMGASLLACASVVFALLINMDTQIEMNPNGDELARQNAIGFRVFAWGAVALLVLLLATGIIGSWLAYRRGHSRRAFGFSLLAAAPGLLSAAGFAALALLGAR